jgi:predicted ATPase
MFKLKIKNFRGLIEEEFNFSRVNILIGENSSGKSSILKFLLALKQSLLSPNNQEYNITLSGIEADLGNYDEVIYNHERERNLGFSFEFYNEYFNFFLKDAVNIVKNTNNENLQKTLQEKRNEITNLLGGKIVSPTKIEFELTNDLSLHQNIFTKISNPSIGELEILHPKTEQEIFIKGKSRICNLKFSSLNNITFIFENIEYEKRGFITTIYGDNLKNKIKEQLINDENPERVFWQIAYLLIIQNYIENFLGTVAYINPILSEPVARVYLKRDEKITLNIRDIKEVVYLLSGENFLKGKSLEKFEKEYINALSKFGIVDNLNVIKDNHTRELRVNVSGIENNIKDVGFGVSLQLPIFAQSLISERLLKVNDIEEPVRLGGVLLIEQPEIHLHPSLQANFIDALLNIGENNIYIIETHSEHIVRKLQVLVKEEKYNLRPDDVSINYFRKSKNKMVKSNHKIDYESGKLHPKFPKGFYDVSYDLAFQLME